MTPSILTRSRTIMLAGAVVSAAAAALLRDPRFGLGVLAAGLWAWANLRALEGLLDAAVVPLGARRVRRRMVRWAIVKIGIYALAIWALIVRPFPAASLLVGVTWLPLAFVIAGVLPAPRSGTDATTRG